MIEHDDREAHEAKADEVERELDDMEQRQDRLGEEIDEASDEWGRKKRDERVPGALDRADDDEDDEDEAEELDFGRDIDSDAVVGEAPSDDEDDR
jgi:hypothetical protein